MMNELKLSSCTEISPAEPLWKRAPTHDDSGQRLSDFMMIIPKLGKRSSQHIQQTLNRLQAVVNDYQKAIVFVDLNLRLNVLWVSVKPIPGICLELPTAIKARVPEAILVAQPPREH
jgi:hypothetical protein